MITKDVKINKQSIETELSNYIDKPYNCIFEYIWNSLDAGAKEIEINYKGTDEKKVLEDVRDVEIIDNGKGWDFDKDVNTETFLSSTKAKSNTNQKTLPKGRFGRGRYVFIWIANKIEIYSKKKKLVLKHDTKLDIFKDDYNEPGTKICFRGIYESFSTAILSNNQLEYELLIEFGWFIKANPNIKIKINGSVINTDNNIKKLTILKKNDFSEIIQANLKDDFHVEIILWKEKPSEYSKFYFLNSNREELFKMNTGLNKKSDGFWHSVYLISDFFIDIDKNIAEIEPNENEFELDSKYKKRINRALINEIKKRLVEIRKPVLTKNSTLVIDELKEKKLLPNLHEFGIYDEESYKDLLKTIYVISPSLFVGKNDSEKKFICATFAGLLSTQDNHLIQVILEQLEELTENEKDDLLSILQRSSLSNIINTIKEIDHRLDIIEKLKILLYNYKKETLEVKHLQKILDKNFWIFGEQFRLFSSTEGALKKVLADYATEILCIKNPVLNTHPKGEVDLFLTKTESPNDKKQENIIVEIKRPSKKLNKACFDQIEKYMRNIKKQNICNGKNQYWEFYLIGNDYDDYIEDKIKQMKSLGEQERGLVAAMEDYRFKIYIRKWSDILEVEWGAKMKYLKEKLEIKAKQNNYKNPADIVESV